MKGVIKWFSRNHVAANSLMLAVLLAGFYTWFQLRKEMFPEVSVDAISIGIPYPNASPEDVEEGVVEGDQKSSNRSQTLSQDDDGGEEVGELQG